MAVMVHVRQGSTQDESGIASGGEWTWERGTMEVDEDGFEQVRLESGRVFFNGAAGKTWTGREWVSRNALSQSEPSLDDEAGCGGFPIDRIRPIDEGTLCDLHKEGSSAHYCIQPVHDHEGVERGAVCIEHTTHMVKRRCIKHGETMEPGRYGGKYFRCCWLERKARREEAQVRRQEEASRQEVLQRKAEILENAEARARGYMPPARYMQSHWVEADGQCPDCGDYLGTPLGDYDRISCRCRAWLSRLEITGPADGQYGAVPTKQGRWGSVGIYGEWEGAWGLPGTGGRSMSGAILTEEERYEVDVIRIAKEHPDFADAVREAVTV